MDNIVGYKMPVRTNYKLWRLCAWAGVVYLATQGTFWGIIGHFLPPPNESWTPQQVYQFYIDNNTRIRVGMMLTLTTAPFYYMWSVVVSRLIARSEGPDGVLSMVELMGGVLTVVITFASVCCWLSASFDTALKTPDATKAMSDLGWMWFNPTAIATTLQFTACGIGFMVDPRPEGQRIMPSWIPWFSFAMAGTLLLALLTPFFHTGPFAWNGIFTYYVGLGGYFAWIVVLVFQVFKSIDRVEREDSLEAIK